MSKRVNLRAIHFDGELDPDGAGAGTGRMTGIRVEDSDALSFTDNTSDKPFSVSFWAKVANNALNSHGGCAIAKADFDGQPDGTRANEWLARFEPANAGGGRFGLYLYDLDTVAGGNSGAQLRAFSTDGTLIQNNTWHHVVCTYSGNPDFGANDTNSTLVSSGIKVYFDGQNVPATESRTGKYAQMHNAAGVFSIGSMGEIVDNENEATDPKGHLRVFKGHLADVCIFNKELSAAEAAEVYNSGKVKDMTKFSAYSSIVSWWKMGDDQDHIGTNGIRDYVGTHHGTMQHLDNTKIVTDPSLPTDRIGNSGVMVPSSWGRTRGPKNVAGDNQVFIHGGISGDMPTALPTQATDGYATENQRYLHMYWKATQTNKTHNIQVYTYKYATGTWHPLKDVGGSDIVLNTTNAAIDEMFVFEIAGSDRVYFRQANDALLSTDLFAAAVSTF
tara:strand:- start:1253 stop:2587 length:1335 start_codon:yes stop_codon:yes gene_type:complete